MLDCFLTGRSLSRLAAGGHFLQCCVVLSKSSPGFLKIFSVSLEKLATFSLIFSSVLLPDPFSEEYFSDL